MAYCRLDWNPAGLQRNYNAAMNELEHNEMLRLLEADIRELVPLVFSQNKPISEGKIRLIAVILRRWLVDGDLKKLVAPLRVSPLFEVQATSQAVSYLKRQPRFDYLLTAGLMMNNKHIRFISDTSLKPDAVDRSFAFEGSVTLNLKKFLAQPRLYFAGKWFTTSQILRFVANKLGANHIDFDRQGEYAEIDEAHRYFKFGGPVLDEAPAGSEVYLLLEPDSNEIISGLHLEVIAAGASFVNMTIDGKPLVELISKRTMVDRFRNLIRRKHTITLVEKAQCNNMPD